MDIVLKELLTQTSRFVYYQNGSLVYLTKGTNFRFEIPVKDLGTSRVNVVEPNKLLMKWIRKQQRVNEDARAEQEQAG